MGFISFSDSLWGRIAVGASAVLVGLIVVARFILGAYEPPPLPVDVQERQSSASPSGQPTTPGERLKPRPIPLPCTTTSQSFAPTSFTIVGANSWPVVGLGRDADNRPITMTDEGLPLDAFIYDVEGPPVNYGRGVFYGGAHRVENAPSLGNTMLRELSVGDFVVLADDAGNRVCLQLDERIEVPVEDYPDDRVFNVTRAPQQYVFDVCSGVRRGPGDWSTATLFFLRKVK